MSLSIRKLKHFKQEQQGWPDTESGRSKSDAWWDGNTVYTPHHVTYKWYGITCKRQTWRRK